MAHYNDGVWFLVGVTLICAFGLICAVGWLIICTIDNLRAI